MLWFEIFFFFLCAQHHEELRSDHFQRLLRRKPEIYMDVVGTSRVKVEAKECLGIFLLDLCALGGITAWLSLLIHLTWAQKKNKLPLKDTVCAIHLGLRRASTGNANAVKYKRSVIDQIQIVQRGSHQIC